MPGFPERYNEGSDQARELSDRAASAFEELAIVFDENGIKFPEEPMGTSYIRSRNVLSTRGSSVIDISASHSLDDGKQQGVIAIGTLRVKEENLDHDVTGGREYTLKEDVRGRVFGKYGLIGVNDGRDMNHGDLLRFYADIQMLRYILKRQSEALTD
jgi:hypothetical protein